MNRTLRPKTARPATPRPMTMPPVKETFRAWARPVRAACVVRTLASVAMRMPMLPARAENTAPMTKAMTMNQWVVGTSMDTTPRRAPATTTKTARMRYSALRKARAPSWMCLAIVLIFSSPVLWERTQRDWTNM